MANPHSEEIGSLAPKYLGGRVLGPNQVGFCASRRATAATPRGLGRFSPGPTGREKGELARSSFVPLRVGCPSRMLQMAQRSRNQKVKFHAPFILNMGYQMLICIWMHVICFLGNFIVYNTTNKTFSIPSPVRISYAPILRSQKCANHPLRFSMVYIRCV